MRIEPITLGCWGCESLPPLLYGTASSYPEFLMVVHYPKTVEIAVFCLVFYGIVLYICMQKINFWTLSALMYVLFLFGNIRFMLFNSLYLKKVETTQPRGNRTRSFPSRNPVYNLLSKLTLFTGTKPQQCREQVLTKPPLHTEQQCKNLVYNEPGLNYSISRVPWEILLVWERG